MKLAKRINPAWFNRELVLKTGLLIIILSLVGFTSYFGVLSWQRADQITNLLATEAENSNSFMQQKTEKVALFGDTQLHSNTNVHQKIVDAVYTLNPLAVFHLGDAVDSGEDSAQWQTFNAVESKLINNFNFYIAAGNHDKEASLYYDNFGLPGNEKWYSVNYLGVHWVIIDSNLDLMPGSQQYVWLENDLATTREKVQYTTVLMHKDLFTSTFHAEDALPFKDSLISLLEKYDVDIVFSAHAHAYERSYNNGIYYLVCSSAGGDLRDSGYENPASQKFVKSYNYCVAENNNGALTIKAYSEESEEIDSLSL